MGYSGKDEVQERKNWSQQEKSLMVNKNDVILTSYCRFLLFTLLAIPLSLAILSYLIIYPGIYHKNPFHIFTVLYAGGEYLLMLGLIGFTLIPVGLILVFLTAPFKLVFSDDGVHVYSLWFLGSLFLRWEELTEFRVVEVQSKTEGGYRRYYAQIVIVSKKFSTKSRKSRSSVVGPLFPISDNSDAIERILELYQKNQRNQASKVV
jgi:hypothetical protein